MYVLLEGIDRVGKSTQISLLQKALPEALFTKEPGGTELGKKIRDILLHTLSPSPLAELFLFLADRNQHINEIIKPNLEKLIVSDRGFVSGIAYAKIKTDLSLDELIHLNHIALEGIYPDKIVFFEITKEELRKRMDRYPLDSIERRGIPYLLEVQKIMKEVVEHSQAQILILDASQPKERLFKKIIDFIKENHGNKSS